MAEVTEFEWVTEEQRTQLNELWEVRGDWRQWLPDELTSRWPEWPHSTDDVLTPWLDELIPSLILPAEATEEDVQQLAAEVRTLLDDMLREHPELTRMPADELRQMINQAFREQLQTQR